MGETIIFLKGGRCVSAITQKIHARQEHLPILLPPQKYNGSSPNGNTCRSYVTRTSPCRQEPITSDVVQFTNTSLLPCPVALTCLFRPRPWTVFLSTSPYASLCQTG